MAGSPPSSIAEPFEQLLRAARSGSKEAMGKLLGYCRRILIQAARRQMPQDLQAKSGASDLVQESLLEAQAEFDRFRGESLEQLVAWLKAILTHNFSNLYRDYRERSKRQISREVSLSGGDPAARADVNLPAAIDTPSEFAMRREAESAYHLALTQLPAHYRSVIVMRHEGRHSFESIGLSLNCSAEAARNLWRRALKQLGHALKGLR